MITRKVLFIDTTHPVLEEDLTRFGFLCEHFDDFKRELKFLPVFFTISVIFLEIRSQKNRRRVFWHHNPRKNQAG